MYHITVSRPLNYNFTHENFARAFRPFDAQRDMCTAETAGC